MATTWGRKRKNVKDKMRHFLTQAQAIKEENLIGQKITEKNLIGKKIKEENLIGEKIKEKNIIGQKIKEKNLIGEKIKETTSLGRRNWKILERRFNLGTHVCLLSHFQMDFSDHQLFQCFDKS